MIMIGKRFRCESIHPTTDLFLLELDLLLDLPLAQQLRLEVVGHVGYRGVEGDAQKIDNMLEGAKNKFLTLNLIRPHNMLQK